MPLSSEYLNKRKTNYTYDLENQSGLFPSLTTKKKPQDDSFSLFDMLGSGLHHFFSSALLNSICSF